MSLLNKKGFTLMELMVVVLIIGILAGLATPQFIKTRENSRMQSALPVTRTIALGNKMHRLDKGTYGDLAKLMTGKYIADVDSKSIGYSFFACTATSGNCAAVSGFTPLAYAVRSGGRAPYSSWWFSVDGAGNCKSMATASQQPDCNNW